MSNPTLNSIIQHVRNRQYMSGADRDKNRIKSTGEVFTPTPLVQEILDQIPISTFADHTKTFIDNSCGDGQFLCEVLIRKIENGSTFEQALSTIYGVDMMSDNVQLCRDRLLCGCQSLSYIVEKNIVCHDALTYDYSFNGTNFTDTELREHRLGIPPKASGQPLKKNITKKPTVISNTSLFE